MIFVAVGTQKFQLNRLLKALDDLVAEGRLENQIFAQTGHSDYQPRNYPFRDFLSGEEFQQHIRECDLLITHSGVATIVSGLKLGKPVIVFPRLAEFGEHVDDHQLQIAEAFSQQNLVLMCREPETLQELADRARSHTFSRYVSRREQAAATIEAYLDTAFPKKHG